MKRPEAAIRCTPNQVRGRSNRAGNQDICSSRAPEDLPRWHQRKEILTAPYSTREPWRRNNSQLPTYLQLGGPADSSIHKICLTQVSGTKEPRGCGSVESARTPGTSRGGMRLYKHTMRMT